MFYGVFAHRIIPLIAAGQYLDGFSACSLINSFETKRPDLTWLFMEILGTRLWPNALFILDPTVLLVVLFTFLSKGKGNG